MDGDSPGPPRVCATCLVDAGSMVEGRAPKRRRPGNPGVGRRCNGHWSSVGRNRCTFCGTMMQGWTWTEGNWTRTVVFISGMEWDIGWEMLDYLNGNWYTTIVGNVDQVTGYWNDGGEERTELD
jgi:hypothetical protein